MNELWTWLSMSGKMDLRWSIKCEANDVRAGVGGEKRTGEEEKRILLDEEETGGDDEGSEFSSNIDDLFPHTMADMFCLSLSLFGLLFLHPLPHLLPSHAAHRFDRISPNFHPNFRSRSEPPFSSTPILQLLSSCFSSILLKLIGFLQQERNFVWRFNRLCCVSDEQAAWRVLCFLPWVFRPFGFPSRRATGQELMIE